MPEGTAKIDITVFSIFSPHRFRYKCQTIFLTSISGKFALCSQMKLPFFVAKHKKPIGFQQKKLYSYWQQSGEDQKLYLKDELKDEHSHCGITYWLWTLHADSSLVFFLGLCCRGWRVGSSAKATKLGYQVLCINVIAVVYGCFYISTYNHVLKMINLSCHAEVIIACR